MAHIHIGTSGWHYDDWTGPFYPEDMNAKDFLACYAESFQAVEINASFYRLPTKKALKDWHAQTPRDFVFAAKASRYITHMKKLKDPKQSSAKFFTAVKALGNKLGPILFQLPPNWRVNAERLAAFLDALPGGHRYAFEFRDETWFCDEVLDLLRAHKAAFCIYDLDRKTSPKEVTADFVYVRLHGPKGPYKGSYDDNTLKRWADDISRWRKGRHDVYVFFDNDQKGYAPRNALRLRELVG